MFLLGGLVSRSVYKVHVVANIKWLIFNSASPLLTYMSWCSPTTIKTNLIWISLFYIAITCNQLVGFWILWSVEFKCVTNTIFRSKYKYKYMSLDFFWQKKNNYILVNFFCGKYKLIWIPFFRQIQIKIYFGITQLGQY